MMRTLWTVYALLDPRDGAIRYVGVIEGSLWLAIKMGFGSYADSRKDRWLRRLRGLGLFPRYKVLIRASTSYFAYHEKSAHSKALKGRGFSLLSDRHLPPREMSHFKSKKILAAELAAFGEK